MSTASSQLGMSVGAEISAGSSKLLDLTLFALAAFLVAPFTAVFFGCSVFYTKHKHFLYTIVLGLYAFTFS